MDIRLWLTLVTILAVPLLVNQIGCENDDDSTADDDGAADDDGNDDDATVDDDVSDDDAIGDDDTDPNNYPPECDGDTPPELYVVNLIVNGEVVEQPYTATTDDTIALSLDYFDAECNFNIPDEPPAYRGKFLVFLDDREEQNPNLSEEAYDKLYSHHWFLPGIGCSSEESGLYVIELDPQDWVVDESEVREYPFIASLVDGCDASSAVVEEVYLDFTVNPAE